MLKDLQKALEFAKDEARYQKQEARVRQDQECFNKLDAMVKIIEVLIEECY